MELTKEIADKYVTTRRKAACYLYYGRVDGGDLYRMIPKGGGRRSACPYVFFVEDDGTVNWVTNLNVISEVCSVNPKPELISADLDCSD